MLRPGQISLQLTRWVRLREQSAITSKLLGLERLMEFCALSCGLSLQISMDFPARPDMEHLQLFEALPPDWTILLDPASFLKLKSTHRVSFLNSRALETYWAGLCRSRLERLINADGSCTVELRFDVAASHQPPTDLASSSKVDCPFAAALSLQNYWKSLARELIGDAQDLGSVCQRQILRKPAAQHAAADSEEPQESEEEDRCPSLCPGSLSATVGNELRHSMEDFQFPELPDARATPEIHTANLLQEVNINKDGFGRFTSCHLNCPLGGDRCVMAKYPLPWQGAATALPTEFLHPFLGGRPVWKWRVSRQPCAYYEIEIKSPTNRALPARELPGAHCVSVGLALATLPLRGLCRQQAGWNAYSWALHGDDGQMYHGHGQGQRFNPLWVAAGALQGDCPKKGYPKCSSGAAPKDQQRRHARTPRFSVGDVVGCGVCRLDDLGYFGIFFSLNGELLGVCFLVFAAVEPRFYPCVGIDTPFDLSFNFGCKPFRLDLHALDSDGLQRVCTQQYAATHCADVSSRVMEFPISHWRTRGMAPEEDEEAISVDSSSVESSDANTSSEDAYYPCSASPSPDAEGAF